MDVLKLAVLGAGNLRCSVPVIASLASYFGERKLEVRFYDADEERLDLFDRFARIIFSANHAEHHVVSTSRAEEAMKGADRAILQVGANCAQKAMRLRSTPDLDVRSQRVSKHLRRILPDPDPATTFVSLQADSIEIPLWHYYTLEWPGEMSEGDETLVPHQVLRWIRADDYLYDIIKTHEQSPLKQWMEDPTCAVAIHTR